MWRNYVTVGLRSLAKNRAYAAINIAGLAIGMAACLLILLFVRYETGYDRWIPDAENTYQLETWYPHPKGQEPLFLQMSNYASAAALKKDFPQVDKVVYMLSTEPVVLQDGQVSTAEGYMFTDGDFLSVVNLPLLKGPANALGSADTVVLTRSEAVRRFGTADVIGRTLTLIAKGEPRDFRITGVLRDLPRNSHLKINALIRRDFQSLFAKEPQFLTCWECQAGWVYVKLKPGTDPHTIEAGMPAWEKRNIPDESAGETRYNPGEDADWHLVNVHDVHLGRAQDAPMTPGNDRRTIATFAVIALLILGMAIVNFTNLATARAGQRAREVSLRKVLGATRRQLVAQFIGESIIVSAIAMLTALALAELLVRPLSAFLDADLRVTYFGTGGIVLPVIVLVLVVGVLAGIYPALFLTRFQPADVLKANRSAAETPGSGRLRSILVVGQFAVSIGLIICTLVVYTQTVYARSVDPGFRRDHILQVEGLNRYQLLDKGEAIVAAARRVDGVVAVGRGDIGVATRNQSNTTVLVAGNPKPLTIGVYSVDTGFRDAMGLDLVAGRWFDERRPMDDMTVPFPRDPAAERAMVVRGANIVVNELAAKRLGFASAADAVGKQVRAALFANGNDMVPATIVGVVRNARFRTVRTPIEPILFEHVREAPSNMIVRYRGDPVRVYAGIGAAWKGIARDVPFEAKFSEDIVRDLYKAEDARAKMFAGFAVLAVAIGCLGLFGLAAFTAERRTKEIGIRKVLGASTRRIVQLLVWQFSRPVLIANLIAWPVAWWLMRDWLNGFDARIALGPLPFLAAGLLALAIAVATIAAHSLRVARANPILALRYE